jgi:probable phosphoglycerate mutase
MKLLIVRHGDPDYSIDSLTPTGWEEAELLSNRLTKLDVKAFYVSPLGRAKDTAAATLNKLGRTAQVMPWLREFPPAVLKPSDTTPDICWDWLPQDWTAEPLFYDREKWTQPPVFADAGVQEAYKAVAEGLDALLAEHGYVRSGNLYRAERPNEDTVVLVCHFGLECVLLSHLLGVSPMVLWHGTAAAPTSMTTLVTEERREGIAAFRMTAFGDISHLYVADREPSFACRFCETFANKEQRHD